MLEGAVREHDKPPASSSLARLATDRRGIRIVHVLMLVALVLGAVGGQQAADAASSGENGGRYTPGGLSRAGTALMIVGYAVLAGMTGACCVLIGPRGRGSSGVGEAEEGHGQERRLLFAVILSLPPLLVRLVYAAASTFGGGSSRGTTFGVVTGDTGVLVGMAIIMEMLVVAIVEAVGLTVKRPRRGPASGVGVGVGAGGRPVSAPSTPGGWAGSAREPLRRQEDGIYGDGGYGHGHGDEGYVMEDARDHDRHRRHLQDHRRGLERRLF